ncbi:TylF/MycF/NovP-related O-methyltransferase [Flavobacterium defluvii]|uniref:Macrocin-O-methyltransferase (TylF) n=1 Tax=Flavobacterium defluvii TaxID=370979 RepID=A0A1M5NWJ6_9FLAO|nr:TylF/MycF/NovP-related O-methyltransferase [Flavobacterium defluvii]SHG93353.1 Macrocin-O-methyltransferase (TylF) [Flavobacterium defluvii]
MINKIKRQIDKLKWFLKNHNRINSIESRLKRDLKSNHYLGPITYDTDSLTTSNNCDFITEPRFAKAYQTAVDTKPWDGFTLQWRTYIVCWFADLVKNLEGDFVECGVNTGAYSRAIIEYIDFQKTNKKFYLLDTYEGLVPAMITEAEKQAGIEVYLNGHYENVYDRVVTTFSNFNVKIIKGIVPDTLKECDAEKISYLSIDMNCVEPEIAAANYFWDKIVTGGVIILDDYGFPLHIEQKKAFDLFALEKGQSILSLPTGQGIIIKK